MKRVQRDERLTMKQKNANKHDWYKRKADSLDSYQSTRGPLNSYLSRFKKMQINYDLYNGILNDADFEYVMKPYGSEIGELPASMTNKDIVSGKINSILGMEQGSPFSWTVVATNPEATTRKEQEEFGKMREYVVSQIVEPIKQQLEMQAAQEMQDRELTQEEQYEIQERVQQELQAMTPDEVKKYMQREHQDPAEVLATQLLNYLVRKTDFKRKSELCLKHGLLSALGVCYVGIFNDEPELWNVNSMRFSFENSPDIQFIEDAESATCEYRMSPSAVIKYFGSDLTDEQIDNVYQYAGMSKEERVEKFMEQETMVFSFSPEDDLSIRVLHCVWKSLRKIGFLTYMDQEGVQRELIVSEEYKINEDAGDIKIEWEWIPEVYETWKINDFYVRMRPVPGQFKDLENIRECKLPYYGVIYDNLNSYPTSIMDRLKVYQYFYNIIFYKIELLLASDKGKKILMNIKSIPSSSGIDIEKWQYFFESTPFMWYDDSEEGTGYADANTLAKVMDMSLISDIDKYINLAEYLRQQAGRSIGITDQMEGQIAEREAVTNVRTGLEMTSNIIRPILELHAYVKRNLLQALLEMAKVAYHNSGKSKLSYVLDDLSKVTLDLDIGLLDSSTFGLFIANSGKAEETKKVIEQMSFAALQNQRVELSDIISIMRTDDIIEAGEILQVAEGNRREYEAQMQKQEQEAQAQESEKARDFLREKHEMDKELVVLKAEEDRKTKIAVASITGASFNPDVDEDNDGLNDFLTLAEQTLKEEIEVGKLNLERDKLNHQKTQDKEKNKIEREKIKAQRAKKNK